MQRMELERIARHFKIALRELPAPTDDDVAAVAGTRLTALLEARFRKLNGLERLRVARYVPLVRALAAQDEGGDGELMLAMLLDACHQQSLRESRFPEGLPEPRENGGKAGRSRRKRSARREDGGAEEREAAPAESVPQSGADGGDGHDGSGTDGEGRSARRRSGRRRRGRGRREQDGEAMQPGAADAGDET